MESDPFSRSLFLNKFWRGILWKIDNESESEKKKKKKRAISHSQFREKKCLNSDQSYIWSNSKIDTKRKSPTVKLNLSSRPFHNSSTKITRRSRSVNLASTHPDLADLIITLELSITRYRSDDKRDTRFHLWRPRDSLWKVAQKKPG